MEQTIVNNIRAASLLAKQGEVGALMEITVRYVVNTTFDRSEIETLNVDSLRTAIAWQTQESDGMLSRQDQIEVGKVLGIYDQYNQVDLLSSDVTTDQDFGLDAVQLEAKYDDEHPTYAKQHWRDEVENQDTKLGYWEWVLHQVEMNYYSISVLDAEDVAKISADAKRYQWRIVNGEFSQVDDKEDPPKPLVNVVSEAYLFIIDTADAVREGHLSEAYTEEDIEIVCTDGTMLTLEEADTLLEG